MTAIPSMDWKRRNLRARAVARSQNAENGVDTKRPCLRSNYPAEGGIPASAQSTTFSPNEPVREELTCGGRSFTAIYFPTTKFFGPALNLRLRHIQGGQFRNSVEERVATDAAVRACIQSIERSKPIVQQLPATAWDVSNTGFRRFGLLPGGVEHLVFDPQTQQVLGWTKRDGLVPLQFPD